MTQRMNAVLEALASNRYQDLLDAIPYVRHLGIRVEGEQDARKSTLLFHLPFRNEIIGNPMLPALHGGVVGALLETASMIQVIASERQSRMPRLIDFSVDYLRSARTKDCWAECNVVRMGSSIAAVSVRCWQDDETAPIATARAHLLLVEPMPQQHGGLPMKPQPFDI
ncbi:hypothetical protein AQB9606_03123 [Aquabacterium sp. CECT 9606]|nr:hypothetical protein AQB9606_03123 [Aquabacterium sp. CECT 9606]